MEDYRSLFLKANKAASGENEADLSTKDVYSFIQSCVADGNID